MRTVRLRSAYQTVDVVADPTIAELLVVEGNHQVQREQDALVVSDRASGGFRFANWQDARRLALRMNPQLELDVQVVGAALSISGLSGTLRAVVQAGTATIEDVSSSMEVWVVSGLLRVGGSPQDAWHLRAESASLELTLEEAADATVSISGRHSRVELPGSDSRAVFGSGARTVDIDATFSDVVVRTR
ncbi:MAG: hypothetical protein ABI323_15165 [Solirubrobacteraceae bacterium]